jgi:methyl-accepting chemotaxis protein PixJ
MNSPSQPNSAKNTSKSNYENSLDNDNTAFNEQPSELQEQQNFNQLNSEPEPSQQLTSRWRKRGLGFRGKLILSFGTTIALLAGVTAIG